MATSTAQTIPLVEVYDYYLAPGDPATAATSKGKVGRTVKATLQYDKAITISPDPVVWTAGETVYTTLTDANGFWHLFLVPNTKLSPANTYYTIEIDGGPSYQIQVTDVGVPAPGWQSSAPGILLNIPAALAPTTSTVGAITATGLITAQAGINITAGGLTVAGGETETGGLTVDSLAFSVAVSQIKPGGTSLSLRNSANNADNLIVTDVGNVTIRGSLTVTAGPLTVSALGAAITGNSTVTGTLTVTAAFTVSAGGAAITGTSTVTGTLSITALVTAQAGLLISAGTLQMNAAASQLVPGATSFALRNNANSANNLLMTDAGLATFRNAVSIPASAAGTVAPTSYGTVTNKVDEQTGSAVASLSLTVPSGLYRTLIVDFIARSDQAAGANVVMQLATAAGVFDAGANYDSVTMADINTTITGTAPTIAGTSGAVGGMPGTNANAAALGQFRIIIENADAGQSTLRKAWHFKGGYFSSDAAAGAIYQEGSGQWRDTTHAVFGIKLLPAAGNFSVIRATVRGEA